MKRFISRIKSVTSIICVSFAVITILSAISSLWASHSRPFLIVASTGFVFTSLTAFMNHISRYGVFVIVALIFCWFGDFLGHYNFIASLLAFLLAHLAFIVAFFFHGVNKKGLFVSLGIFLISSSVIFHWLYPFVPDSDKIFVSIYMIVITAMVVLALGTRSSLSQIIISLGALLFYISDIFVARWKFVDQDSVNAFFCYPLYYTSCLLFALSILVYRKQVSLSKSL